MKLFDAKLCVQCDEIVEIRDPVCPSCTCAQFIPLAELIPPLEAREEINLVRFMNSGKESRS